MIHFIKPYTPEWGIEFGKLKAVLEAELKGFDLDIQHVGSTAVPGLSAKPILDVDIIIADKTFLHHISARLENIGYTNKGEQGIPGRFAFGQTSDYTPITIHQKQWQPHHLYICFTDSLALKNHLLFRNALLKDKMLVEQYARLKMSLIGEQSITREEYTKRKTEFIISVLAKLGLETEELNEIKNVNL